jgi:hypothetical protein
MVTPLRILLRVILSTLHQGPADRWGHYVQASEAPRALVKFSYCRFQFIGAEVRPKATCKKQLCVGTLPQQEITQPLFAASPYKKVNLGNT